MIDKDTGRKRQAYADELIQPQELFLFYAEEERRRRRNGDDDSNSGVNAQNPQGVGGRKTHHIT